jgi:dipeptidase E
MRLYLSSFRNGNKPEELLQLLGDGRRTALIGNATDFLDDAARKAKTDEEISRLQELGLEPTEVDLRDYFGKPAELAKALQNFDLIWARGGNIFILRRAFRQSGADDIIAGLLKKDSIVYGGYSAGIDVLTPNLHGVELVDDPHAVPAGYNPEIIWECMGLLPYSIAPHYKSDHPESADIDKSIEYLIDHHMLFKALRDGEAIVVNGDSERIVG